MPCQNITLNPLISQTAVRNTCQVTNVKFEAGRVVGWFALKYVLICRSRVPLFTCGYTRESLQHYYTGLLHNWSSCVRYFFVHDSILPHNTRFPRQTPHNFPRQTPHNFARQTPHNFPRQIPHNFPRQTPHNFPRQTPHNFQTKTRLNFISVGYDTSERHV
jgi:hypothetical protein